MKVILGMILGTLVISAKANVLDLGTINSSHHLLDQRLTMGPTEQERREAMKQFYLSRHSAFEANLTPQLQYSTKTQKDLDQEWSDLLGGGQ